MEPPAALDHLNFLKLIAHDVRWQILTALAQSDLRVHEITGLLGQPQNLISYHLKQLKRAQLVQERQSLADARSIYYHLHYANIQAGLQSAESSLLPLSLDRSPRKEARQGPMRVLFVCTHNSARSQMAEGLLRAWGGAGVEAASAGSEPKAVHPLAIQAMQEKGIDISQQRAKGLEAVALDRFDYVITVCDRARENCPVFAGQPVQIHWSIPDPAGAPLPEFRLVADQLGERIRYLLGRFPTSASPPT